MPKLLKISFYILLLPLLANAQEDSTKSNQVDSLSFQFLSWVEEPAKAIVSVEDSGKVLFGVFDLQTQAFIIPPKYEHFEKIKFENTVLKCPTKDCHYFYLATDSNSQSFFDENLNSFYPRYVVDWKLEDRDSSIYQIQEYDKQDNRILKVFESKGIKIGYIISGSGKDQYGALVQKIGPLSIIAVYKNEKSQAKYGLQKSESDTLLLPPFFDKIRFDIEPGELEITYKKERGKIRLKRYTY